MDILTVDFETYYSKTFSLTKLTTEQYVRSPEFEVIGLGVKVNAGETDWISGPFNAVKEYLHDNYDWENSAVLAHNTMFDGAILSWLFDIHPRLYLDTLCMARALHGTEVGGSLKYLADMYGIGEKGREVENAIDKRLTDFTDEELERYGDYCTQDVELTYQLFEIFLKVFPKKELKVIDMTLRMFIDPILELDVGKLEDHLDTLQAQKEKLLEECGIEKEELMSNPKFAKALESLGVTPPMKTSLRTGKETFAFAKSDEGFKALQEHDDTRVQALVAARIGLKSTLEETRTERFIDIGIRGTLPVPIRYYAAHTGRFGGSDKINLQNLPSRGPNAKVLKSCICAPQGHTLIEADSAQIEARVLAWLAGQVDLVRAFEKGEDVYKKMAATIYNKKVEDVDSSQRFIGKTTILGCIGAGTRVLCETGWKPIEQVTTQDRLWDGENWVCHQGLLEKGLKETVNLCGSWLTPDHKILCGTQWKETQSVVQDGSTLSQALVTGAAKLPLEALSGECGEALRLLSLNAIADDPSIQSTDTTLKTLGLLAAQSVLSKQQAKNAIGSMLKPCQMIPIGQDYSTDFLLLSHGAITQETLAIKTTGVGAYGFTTSGEKTEPSFSLMYRHLKGGITRAWKWIASTMTAGTSQTTYGSQPEAKTCETNAASKSYSKKLMTYDLAYAGPNNRFTIWTDSGPVIAHNCGYGMGAAKFHDQLKGMGVEVEEEECKRIIRVYRSANGAISQLWRDAQNALMGMYQGERYGVGKEGVLRVLPEASGIRLPSGLIMRYTDLKAEDGEMGVQFSYKTRRGRVNIYGGKVTENVCQGIARCVMSDQMLMISKRYPILLTVHDSVVCCVPDNEVDEAAAYVDECMRHTPDWAEGLPVRGDVEVGKNYGEVTEWVNSHGPLVA